MSGPVPYLDRFGDAIQLLCAGERPPKRMLADWLDKSKDSFELQEFALAYGPTWAQGIVVIEAALVLADSPEEGVDHPGRPA